MKYTRTLLLITSADIWSGRETIKSSLPLHQKQMTPALTAGMARVSAPLPRTKQIIWQQKKICSNNL